MYIYVYDSLFFFNAYLNPFGNITFTILYIHIYNYIDTFQYNIRTIKWAYTHNYREGDTHEKKEIIKKKKRWSLNTCIYHAFIVFITVYVCQYIYSSIRLKGSGYIILTLLFVNISLTTFAAFSCSIKHGLCFKLS